MSKKFIRESLVPFVNIGVNENNKISDWNRRQNLTEDSKFLALNSCDKMYRTFTGNEKE